MKKEIRAYLCITLLAFLMAANYEVFILPNAFAPAGINGVATMIQYKLGFSIGYMNLLINLPLCAVAFFLLAREYSLKTLWFCLTFSLFLLVFKHGILDLAQYAYVSDTGTSTVLAPVAASVINGFIYGCLIRMNCSTGGTDIIAAMIRRVRPHLNLVWVIFALNACVALASFFVYDFQFEPVIVCIIYCFVTTRVSDSIVKGIKEEIKFEIVTDHPEALSREIIETLHHSATVLPATGMYSGKQTDLLICIINKYQIVELQKILARYPESFAYISKVTETVGNFKHKAKQKQA